MKFGAQLDLYAVPEWRDKYIAYNALKRFLTRRSGAIARRRLEQSSNSSVAVCSLATKAAASLLHPLTTGVSKTAGPTVEEIDLEFLSLLDEELKKVQYHFHTELGILKDKIQGAEEELSELDAQDQQGQYQKPQYHHNDVSSETYGWPMPLDQNPHDLGGPLRSDCEDQDKESRTNMRTKAAHKQRLSRAVIAIWELADRLEGFVQLNSVALYKILKKRDKLLGLTNLPTDLQDKKRALGLLVVSQFLRNSLLRVYRACHQNDLLKHSNARFYGSSLEVPSSSQDVQSLTFLVQKHLISLQKPVATNWVCFFLGICLVLVMDIAIAAYASPTNPAFSVSEVVALFPPFRVALTMCLVAWGAAAATAIFEIYGVNYKFLLDINPKCQVASSTLFGVASLLTSVWIVGFAFFVVDVKFALFLPNAGYWVYPFMVCLLQAVVSCLPSKTFIYEYRKNLLLLFWKTLKSGFVPTEKVTLTSNIMGDILTSLPKPFIDVEYTFLLYCRLLVSGTVDAEAFNIDSPGWSIALVTFLPYWIRFIQCFKRFCREPDLRSTHLANMGKYFSTMAVIVTSSLTWGKLGVSIYASRLTFVFAYLFASLYNLIWDVVMDWGLMPDPDHFVRYTSIFVSPNHRLLYPQWLYYAITVFNLLGRLTWALTLIPIGIINNEKVNASIILLLISSLEILRRSAWVILRLENEHLTNSSRYRAILWVPKVPVADSCIDSVNILSRKESKLNGSALLTRQKSWNDLNLLSTQLSHGSQESRRLRRLQSDPSLNSNNVARE